MKKVCFIAPNLLGGGAERVISILAKKFAEQGYKVDLIVTEKVGPYFKDIPDSVNIIDFNCKKLILALPKLVNYLKNTAPDILFTSHIHVSTIAAFAKAIARVKTNVIIRQPTMLLPSQKRKSFSNLLRLKIFLLSLSFVNKIILTSEYMKEEFLQYSLKSKDKIVVIHNPIDIDSIQAKSYEKISQDFFNDYENIPIIISVGRLNKVKDFSTLIKAFSIVNKNMPCRLIILGEGELRNEIISLAKDLKVLDLISMPGFVENPYKYMRNSKVFVSSSLWEGFPNGLVEAMSCGLDIVATNCEGGSAEILENGKWGKLVPIKDEFSMANAIIECLQSPSYFNVLDRANHFSTNKIIRKYENIFLN
ncbi:glycosyltransferase [Acinetobacter johnsonii]|nr:glycosyltransferase [Acinetobacter johnsonii]